MNGYYDTEKVSQDKTTSARYYAGVGAEYTIGSHKLSLTGNYVMRNYGTFGFRCPDVHCLSWLYSLITLQ